MLFKPLIGKCYRTLNTSTNQNAKIYILPVSHLYMVLTVRTIVDELYRTYKCLHDTLTVPYRSIIFYKTKNKIYDGYIFIL